MLIVVHPDVAAAYVDVIQRGQLNYKLYDAMVATAARRRQANSEGSWRLATAVWEMWHALAK